MRKNIIMILAVIWIGSLSVSAQNTLSYTLPAKEWMQALPIGNGRIGAMIYGGINKETIALSEVTLWSGKRDSTGNDLCGKERLEEMRTAFFKGNIALGNALGNSYLNGRGQWFGTNLPFGNLIIDFEQSHNNCSKYKRTLNMEDALAKVEYIANRTTYKREFFCNNPSNSFVAFFSAKGNEKLKVKIFIEMLRYGQVEAKNGELIITGDARSTSTSNDGVKFHSIFHVIKKGGTIKKHRDTLYVEDASEFVIVADLRTSYNNPEYQKRCRQTVDSSVNKGYATLKKEHKDDFKHLYNRMDIRLGSSFKDDETSENLYRIVKRGGYDARFDALFFKYGRYMLISSSRENSPLPAHLQGIWNDNLACNMAWTCDYHLDINIQQNYWSANIANLAECNTPLFGYIGQLTRYGSKTARKMYGCRGWVAHTINNVWGATYPGNGIGWAMNVTAGAWMATHLWTHYQFTQDSIYLRTMGYPLLKKTAQFFVDYMVKDPSTGYIVTGPSISPENGFRMKDGSCYSLSMMPTIDRIVVYDIYKSCIEASKILNVDEKFREQLERDMMRLPPLKVGKDGMLQEWLMDVTRQDPAHRHASHLLALYPFYQITIENTPFLAQACKKFLSWQTSQPNWEDNEWSRGNMICFYARLKEGNNAYESITKLYQGFMRENLMTVSPAGVAGAQSDIFSFDATEAAVAGMCEMLLQSHNGYLHFLPALPDIWKEGYVKGICARGGLIIDIEWKEKKVKRISMKSSQSKQVHCLINGERKTLTVQGGRILNIKMF